MPKMMPTSFEECLNKFAEKADKFAEKAEMPKMMPTSFEECLNKIAEKADKFAEKADKFAEKADKFAEKAERWTYTKLPYAQWKVLQKMSQGHDSISMKRKGDIISLSTWDCSTEVNAYDDSFGTYLVDNYVDFQKKIPVLEDDGLSSQCSGTALNDVSNAVTTMTTALNDFGIATTTTNGTLLNSSDIISQLTDKWNDIPLENTITMEKENSIMKNFNFDFGPCTSDNVRLSLYGVAVKNTAGTWVSLNPTDGKIVDVDVFSFDGGKFMYKMPVAIADVMIGDVIVHNRTPMFVNDVSADGKISAVDIRVGEEKVIIPTTNMFGFNFVTKIVSLMNAIGDAPSTEAPFGNMLPFLMMEDGGDIDPMVMMAMMSMGKGGNDMFSNPMMMIAMMGSKSKNDMLPIMMAMSMNK